MGSPWNRLCNLRFSHERFIKSWSWGQLGKVSEVILSSGRSWTHDKGSIEDPEDFARSCPFGMAFHILFSWRLGTSHHTSASTTYWMPPLGREVTLDQPPLFGWGQFLKRDQSESCLPSIFPTLGGMSTSNLRRNLEQHSQYIL